ncbi:MAG TPA: hypothetical protein VKB88_09090 [Bryobacteraceae bacterium]|nr:hypothetical protein [Bryobacteraceae bacterium]
MPNPIPHLTVLLCASAMGVQAAAEVERVHNPHATAVEYRLAPGETLAMESRPAVTVYLEGGAVAQGDEFSSKKMTLERGQVQFTPAGPTSIRNVGNSELRFVRIEFAGAGTKDVWGKTGLAPNYKLVTENNYTRIYDIRIPAGTTEPQHTHHDRVVVCLSGAKLRHLTADGREETATLETGEIVWRAASTHVGKNLGNTDLWVIAVEPK